MPYAPVDRTRRGSTPPGRGGWGQLLLVDALRRGYTASLQLAALVLMTEAKDERSCLKTRGAERHAYAHHAAVAGTYRAATVMSPPRVSPFRSGA